MAGERKSRFGQFRPDEQTQGAPPAREPAPATEKGGPTEPQRMGEGPYLLRRFPREEALARLGNGVRSVTKYALEDYTQRLKRGGWPATEARVMEGMFILLETEAEFRRILTRFLTGTEDSTS